MITKHVFLWSLTCISPSAKSLGFLRVHALHKALKYKTYLIWMYSSVKLAPLCIALMKYSSLQFGNMAEEQIKEKDWEIYPSPDNQGKDHSLNL